nr:MAG TPA: hypothetical protein [Caudoviricetes sp.]
MAKQIFWENAKSKILSFELAARQILTLCA